MTTLPSRLLRFVVLASVLVDCSAPASSAVPTVRLHARVAFTAEERPLDAPWDVLVAADGSAFVLDFGGGEVIRWDPGTGRVLARFGRSGRGPGEFQMPVAMGSFEGNILIADAGNRQLIRFTTEGKYLDSHSILSVPTGRTTIGTDGALTVELRGAGGFLVGRLDREDSYRTVGKSTSPDGPWNFTAIREEARAGKIHPMTRSQAVGTSDGSAGVWVIVQTENLVLRFDRHGKEVVRTSLLSNDEWRAVFDDYVESNTAEQRPNVLHPLVSATDLHATDSSLFVMLGPATGPGATLVELDAKGRRLRRFVVDGIDQAFRFWIDQAHRRVLLTSVAESKAYVADILPEG